MCVEGCISGVLEIIISHEVFPQRGKNILHWNAINQGPVGGLDIIINNKFAHTFSSISIGHKFWWSDDKSWVSTTPANPPNVQSFPTCKIGHGVPLFWRNRGKC